MLHRNYLKEKISCQLNKEKEKKILNTQSGCELWEQQLLLSWRENRGSSSSVMAHCHPSVISEERLTLSVCQLKFRITPRFDTAAFVQKSTGWIRGDFGRPGRLRNSPFVVFYRLNAKFHISNGIDLFVTVTVCDLEENPALLMLSSTCVFPFMTNMKMDPASFMTKHSSVTWQT